MRKFMALEDEGEALPVENVSDDQLAADVATTDNAVEEVVAGSEEIVEASDIQETVDVLADQTEASLEPAEGATPEEQEEVGLSEETAAAMEAMVDHFYKRLGIPNSKHVSLEAFANKNTRKESTILALENLRTLSARISQGKHIAQEGVMARFGNTMKLIFNTENKVRGKLKEFTSELEAKGSNESLIKEPGWGRSFASEHKTELSASDVIKYLTEYNKFINHPNLIKVIKTYQDICS